MVETPDGRIRLLKNGIKYKTIEELYIKYNGLRLVKRPILFNFTETSLQNCFDSPGTLTIEYKQIFQRTNRQLNPDNLLAEDA